MSKSATQPASVKSFGEGVISELALASGETNENKITVGASLTPFERSQLNDLAYIIGLKPSALIRAAARRTLREARAAGIIPALKDAK